MKEPDMTLTTITASSVTSGGFHSFAASGDELIVGPGIIWGSTDTALFTGTSSKTALAVTILGAAVAGGASTLYSNESSVIITASGSLTVAESSAGNSALYLSGSDNYFGNDGYLSSPQSIGVLSDGSNTIVNNGTIQAATAVFIGLFGQFCGLRSMLNDAQPIS